MQSCYQKINPVSIIRLITCQNVFEANLLKGRLESEGIQCFLTNENFATLLPVLNGVMDSGIHVMVLETDYAAALGIIGSDQPLDENT